jgi:thiamine-phosphate pyrophosphorylase
MNAKIARLHCITQDLQNYSHSEQAGAACKGGATWIQLRVKDKDADQWLAAAAATKKVCDSYKAKLIINDNVRIARDIRASGVHLGKSDMDVSSAREILGNAFIIGATANTLEDVIALMALPVDYIGLGPFRFTQTKANLSPILGLEGISEIINKAGKTIPVIAIGGLMPEDVETLIKAGVWGVAVSGAINKASNPEAAVKLFLEKINK